MLCSLMNTIFNELHSPRLVGMMPGMCHRSSVCINPHIWSVIVKIVEIPFLACLWNSPKVSWKLRIIEKLSVGQPVYVASKIGIAEDIDWNSWHITLFPGIVPDV